MNDDIISMCVYCFSACTAFSRSGFDRKFLRDVYLNFMTLWPSGGHDCYVGIAALCIHSLINNTQKNVTLFAENLRVHFHYERNINFSEQSV